MIRTSEPPEQRQAILYLTTSFVLKQLQPYQEGSGPWSLYQVVEDALPEDVRVVRLFVCDKHCEKFGIVLESESFEPVYEGQEIPSLSPPLITRFTDVDAYRAWLEEN